MKKAIFEIVSNSVAFYRSAKCGGTTMMKWMDIIGSPEIYQINEQKMRWKSRMIDEKKIIKEKLESFCIVRDPIDRFYSAYFHLIHREKAIGKIISPEEFLEEIDKTDSVYADDTWTRVLRHVHPLTWHLGSSPEIFTHIFNLKKIKEVKEYLEQKSKKSIPDLHFNSNNKESYSNYITPNMEKILKERYAQDYAIYGKWM